jgi:hypothetical protein
VDIEARLGFHLGDSEVSSVPGGCASLQVIGLVSSNIVRPELDTAEMGPTFIRMDDP